MKKTFSIIIVIILIIIGIYIYESKNENDYVEISYTESLESNLEDLKFEYNMLEEKYIDLQNKFENLNREYQYDEDLIEILTQQLINNGIIPKEL